MKKLEKLKLDHLSENALDEKQQNALKGGIGEDKVCNCTCFNCSCPSWDGTGLMPPGEMSTDMRLGYINGNSASMRASYFQ